MGRACGVPTFTVTLQPDLKPHESYSEQFLPNALSPIRMDPVPYRIERTLLWTAVGVRRARARVQWFLSSIADKTKICSIFFLEIYFLLSFSSLSFFLALTKKRWRKEKVLRTFVEQIVNPLNIITKDRSTTVRLTLFLANINTRWCMLKGNKRWRIFK